jgi:hypothetical protein
MAVMGVRGRGDVRVPLYNSYMGTNYLISLRCAFHGCCHLT